MLNGIMKVQLANFKMTKTFLGKLFSFFKKDGKDINRIQYMGLLRILIQTKQPFKKAF